MGAVDGTSGVYGRTYTLEEIDNVILPQIKPVKYLLDDVVMFLLYADPRHPIEGLPMMTYQVYLALCEIFPDADTEPVPFVQGRKNLQCESILHSLDALSFTNKVDVSGTSRRDCRLAITPRGRTRIANKFDALPSALREMLVQKRKEWDTFTLAGLREYAATHHPMPPA